MAKTFGLRAADQSEQKAHWKQHKLICDRRRTGQDKVETDAMTNPMESVVLGNIKTYLAAIRDEVLIVVRTPFRIGKADQLHSTSVVVIHFSYEASRDTSNSKFVLDSGEVVRTATIVEAARGAPVYQKILDQQTSGATPESVKGSVCCWVIYSVRWRVSPRDSWTTVPIIEPTWINPQSWTTMGVKVEDKKLLPDWVGYLRRALSQPLPRVDAVMMADEFVETEGEDFGRRVRMMAARR